MTTVLIVEDDAVYRGALARALSREGFTPVEAGGVEAACDCLRTHKPTLSLIHI